jgi:hypothetical protein
LLPDENEKPRRAFSANNKPMAIPKRTRINDQKITDAALFIPYQYKVNQLDGKANILCAQPVWI